MILSFAPSKTKQLPVENIFSPIDYGNSVRMEQIEWLIEDLSFFGKGLGASIKDYSRHSEKTYGRNWPWSAVITRFFLYFYFLYFSVRRV